MALAHQLTLNLHFLRMEKLSIKPNKCNPSFSRDLEICENENKVIFWKIKIFHLTKQTLAKN